MAGNEQEIITRFKADTDALLEAVNKFDVRADQLEKEGVTIPVNVDEKKLSASLGSITQKFLVVEATAKRTGDAGQKAGENISKGMDGAAKSLTEVERLSKSDLDLVKNLIAEASKTPKGAEALAKQLNGAQRAALGALQSMGLLSKEETQVAADAQKLIQAQGKLPGEVQKSVKEFVSLRTQLSNSRNELARLIESGTATREQIRAAAAEAGHLQDRFEDVNATINAFNPDKKFQALTGILQNVAGGFTAVQGIIALTGGNSDELAKSLLKVQAALAVTQGLQSLFGGLKDNLKIIRLLFTGVTKEAKILEIAEKGAAGGAVVEGAATNGLAKALDGAKFAAKGLYATIIANPFVAVAAAIGLIVAGIVAYTSKTKEATETTDELISRLDKLTERRNAQIDRAAQDAAIKSELQFLRDKEAALKLDTKEKREGAIAEAQANKVQRDALLEQSAIGLQIEEQTRRRAKLQEDLAKKQKEFLPSKFFNEKDLTKEEKAELKSINEAIKDRNDAILKLQGELNNSISKQDNQLLETQISLDEKRVAEADEKAKKLLAIDKKNLEDRKRLAAEIATVLSEAEQEALQSTAKNADKGFQERLAGIRETFSKIRTELKEGTPKADLAGIAQANADEVTAVKALQDTLTQNEASALKVAQSFDDRAQKLTEKFAELRKTFGEGTPQANTKAIEAINKAEADALAQLIKDEETEALNLRIQGNEKQADAEKQAGEKLLKIQADSEQKRLDQLKKLLEERNQVIINSTAQLSEVLGEALFQQSNKRVEALQAQHDAEIASIQERFAQELEINQAANTGRAGLTQQGIEKQKELEAQRDQALLEAQKQFNEQRAAEEEAFRKKQRDAIIASLLDIVEAQVQASVASAFAQSLATPDSIATFGISGLARGAIIAALIKGIFAALKASLTGAYEGEAFVGKGRRPDFPGEKDGYAYRLHKGERVVRAQTNRKHFPMLEAMEAGKLDKYIQGEYVMPRFNAYMNGDTGKRMEVSVMPAKFHDLNIVAAQMQTANKLDETNELLFALIEKVGSRPSKRMW